jgi:hypothetical protein
MSTKVAPFDDEEDTDKNEHEADEAGRESDDYDKSSRREWVSSRLQAS